MREKQQMPRQDRTSRKKPSIRSLARGYREMAADEEREREAAEWVEGVTGDIANDPR